jgi:hypothetical protein
MAEQTRKEFEAELQKQGYEITDRDKYHTTFERKIGVYILKGLIHEDCGCRDNLDGFPLAVDCHINIGDKEDDDVRVIKDKMGKTYDFIEFNKVLREIAQELQARVIPELTKRIQLPKELADLLQNGN